VSPRRKWRGKHWGASVGRLPDKEPSNRTILVILRGRNGYAWEVAVWRWSVAWYRLPPWTKRR
jgi:hypothetical protein